LGITSESSISVQSGSSQSSVSSLGITSESSISVQSGSSQSNVSSNSSGAVTPSPLVYWDFEPLGDLTNKTGLEGNYDVGWVNEGATVSEGKCGSGYAFDGVNGYLQVAPNSGQMLPLTNGFTYSAWMKTADNTQEQQCVLAYRQINGDSYAAILGVSAAFGATDFGIHMFGSSNTWVKASVPMSTFTNDVWYHVAGTYDKINLKFYINGVEQASTACTDDAPPFWPETAIEIGTNCGSFPLKYFKGSIDEVRIHDVALSSSQITQVMECAASPDSSSLSSASSSISSSSTIIDQSSMSVSAGGQVATGGTITEDGGYTIHTFTESGTFEVLIPELVCDDAFIVGGGGAGGSQIAGGGGGGQIILVSGLAFSAGSNSIIVGAGGAGKGDVYEISNDGQSSIAGGLEAIGGGGGGCYSTTSDGIEAGHNGGCGGGGAPKEGGSSPYGVGGTGLNGNDGGDSLTQYVGAGGGGWGGAAADASDDQVATDGGSGSQYGIFASIAGSPAGWFCGGGGGGNNGGTAGSGGTGGGGAGASSGAGSDGVENTGGGGGGGAYGSGGGGSGGSGIVILRYLTP